MLALIENTIHVNASQIAPFVNNEGIVGHSSVLIGLMSLRSKAAANRNSSSPKMEGQAPNDEPKTFWPRWGESWVAIDESWVAIAEIHIEK